MLKLTGSTRVYPKKYAPQNRVRIWWDMLVCQDIIVYRDLTDIVVQYGVRSLWYMLCPSIHSLVHKCSVNGVNKLPLPVVV